MTRMAFKNWPLRGVIIRQSPHRLLSPFVPTTAATLAARRLARRRSIQVLGQVKAATAGSPNAGTSTLPQAKGHERQAKQEGRVKRPRVRRKHAGHGCG